MRFCPLLENIGRPLSVTPQKLLALVVQYLSKSAPRLYEAVHLNGLHSRVVLQVHGELRRLEAKEGRRLLNKIRLKGDVELDATALRKVYVSSNNEGWAPLVEDNFSTRVASCSVLPYCTCRPRAYIFVLVSSYKALSVSSYMGSYNLIGLPSEYFLKGLWAFRFLSMFFLVALSLCRSGSASTLEVWCQRCSSCTSDVLALCSETDQFSWSPCLPSLSCRALGHLPNHWRMCTTPTWSVSWPVVRRRPSVTGTKLGGVFAKRQASLLKTLCTGSYSLPRSSASARALLEFHVLPARSARSFLGDGEVPSTQTGVCQEEACTRLEHQNLGVCVRTQVAFGTESLTCGEQCRDSFGSCEMLIRLGRV